ncbi:hypothetical protein POSPLADRAFT_1062947 [Postia placenta MAD-698-R-SB12]|uniref:DUF4939 domain-containing protein n=1 Tax=Postia placenta MAD-698-R-SB12 TaxID=670580 RepID=A0A1X6MJA9_9APHY|nr:hypothetical protein POSPLADRAFT_1062947 [Postia placenta MAD-698-R-SB12]OSX56123.1 hypothetical protein POSPLADRAFT_1062947 [Postia placenta MAD-698-R-SB12]
MRTPTSSPMKLAPKRRRTVTNVTASQAETEVAADPMPLKRKSPSKPDPASSPKKRRTVSKLMTKARELINQEEDVQPVDGARAEDVEADEHPEAVMAEETETITDEDLVDVYIPDGPETIIYTCKQQPCPNWTPQSVAQDYPHYKTIRRAQHPLGPRSTLASQSASRHSHPVSPSSRLPQTVAGPSQARGDLPPDLAPEPESKESVSEEGVLESKSANPARPTLPTALAPTLAVPDIRDLSPGLPPAPSPLSPPTHLLPSKSDQRRATTAASAPAPSSVPPPPIMSSPAIAPDKETLKLLLPLQYDGKTVIKCNRFLLQLRIYWLINTSLTTIELKVQIALSLLDGDARAWATPYFSQLASVQMGVQGVTTPFRNKAAFTATFKAPFGNLNDEAAAQVELVL